MARADGLVAGNKSGLQQSIRGRLSEAIGRGALRASFATAGLIAALIPSLASAQMMSVPGKFDVDASGQATYTMPIQAPPGRGGLAPSLELDLATQAGNGLLGMSGSLGGLLAIGRCPRTLVPDGVRGSVNYNVNDRFCLNGQKLMALSGTYGAEGTEYRTEIDGFSKIISHTVSGVSSAAWFELWTKSGLHMELGNTTDSRLLAKGKTWVAAWNVNKVTDTSNNYFTVTYTVDTTNAVVYPAEIDYGANTATGAAANASIKFTYETRPDYLPNWTAGSGSRVTQRMTHVKTYSGTTGLLDYQFAYTTSSQTSRSLLSSVTLCINGGACLPATSFTWTDNDAPTLGGPYSTTNTSNWVGFSITAADVNGDGNLDFIAYAMDATNGFRVFTMLANGDGTFAAPVASPVGGSWGGGWQLTAGDVNGDGKADLIVYFMGTATNGWETNVRLSNGDGTYGTAANSVVAGNWTGWSMAVGDVDGDGRADLIAYAATSTAFYIVSRISNGDGTFAAYQNSDQTGNWAGWTVNFADVNGDGKVDVVLDQVNSTAWTAYTMLASGTGTFAAPVYAGAWPGNFTGWSMAIGDINGDGKSDLIAYSISSTGWHVYTLVSMGDGTFSESSGNGDSTANWAGWNITVGDLNGDGKADLIAYVITTTGTWNVNVMLGKGDGTLLAPVYAGGNGGNFTGYSLAMADVSGDARTDGIAYRFLSTGASIYTLRSAQAPTVSLTNITDGLGASTSIQYLSMADHISTVAGPDGAHPIYYKGTTATYPIIDLDAPGWVVSRVNTSNGIGGTYSSTYTYTRAQIDLSGRGYLGFNARSVYDLQSNVREDSYFSQAFPYVGLLTTRYKNVYIGGAWVQTNVTNDTLADIVTGTGTATHYFPYVSVAADASWDINAAHTSMPVVTTHYTYGDAYGNATQIVTSTPDGYSKTTTNTYTNDATHWLLGRLTNSTVTSTTP